jgi:hypothetical protein
MAPVTKELMACLSKLRRISIRKTRLIVIVWKTALPNALLKDQQFGRKLPFAQIQLLSAF